VRATAMAIAAPPPTRIMTLNTRHYWCWNENNVQMCLELCLEFPLWRKKVSILLITNERSFTKVDYEEKLSLKALLSFVLIVGMSFGC